MTWRAFLSSSHIFLATRAISAATQRFAASSRSRRAAFRAADETGCESPGGDSPGGESPAPASLDSIDPAIRAAPGSSPSPAPPPPRRAWTIFSAARLTQSCAGRPRALYFLAGTSRLAAKDSKPSRTGSAPAAASPALTAPSTTFVRASNESSASAASDDDDERAAAAEPEPVSLPFPPPASDRRYA